MPSQSRGDKYHIAELLGKGSFGTAHVAIHKETKKKYVLKRIRLARLNEWQRQSSFQEMELVSQLSHPFVVPYVDGWVDRGHTINIVYGYCKKGDLGELLQSKKGNFSEAQLKKWLAQILLAVDYMHQQGVLHRDIKCGNLFLTSENDLKIGDFGLATVRDSRNEPDYSIVGTPHYMSPELLSRQPYGFSTDIWSIGCVMYELTARKPAFNAFNIQGLVHKIRKTAVPPLPSGYSPGWCQIVKSMLRKDPSKRPTVHDLLNHPYMRNAVIDVKQHALEIDPNMSIPEFCVEVPPYWNRVTTPGRALVMNTPRMTPRCTPRQPPLTERPAQNVHESGEPRGLTRHSTGGRPAYISPSRCVSEKENSHCDYFDAGDNALEVERSEPSQGRNPSQDASDGSGGDNSGSEAKTNEGSSTLDPVSLRSTSDPGSPSLQNPSDGNISPEVEVEDEKEEEGVEEDAPRSCEKADMTAMKPTADMSPEKVARGTPSPSKSLFRNAVAANNNVMERENKGPKGGEGLGVIPEGSDFDAGYRHPSSHFLRQPSQRRNMVFSSFTPRSDTSQSRSGDTPREPPLSSVGMDSERSMNCSSMSYDAQKRWDVLERVVSLCAELHKRGRWEEVGHILNHAARGGKAFQDPLTTTPGRTPRREDTSCPFLLGDRVVIGSTEQCHGWIRYFGPVAFSTGDWVGLELDTPAGKNNGTVKGISYFNCADHCGWFVRANMLKPDIT